jgi:predicted MFS family arabinose efflux permease
VVLVLLAIVAAASLFGYPYLTIMPMMARALFAHDDARGLGVLMGGIGAGALAGSAALSMFTPSERRMMPSILVSLALFGLALGAVTFVHAQALVVALLAVCGAAMVVSVALCNTSIQQRIPDAMRGRVLSMYTFAFFAFLPFGNLFAGIVAEHRGLAPTMLAMGVGLVLAASVGAAALGRARARSGRAHTASRQ